MKKALAILTIITVALTGTAKTTYRWLNVGIQLLDDSLQTVSAITPDNQFHSVSPKTQYFRGATIPPYSVDMGTFSGTINGYTYVDEPSIRLLYNQFARWTINGADEIYFPAPLMDSRNPDISTGDYSLLSVDWYPTIYVIKGDMGDVNNNTGRSTLYAIKIGLNLMKSNVIDFFNNSPIAYTDYYYLIISGHPRYYTDATYYVNLYVGGDYNGYFTNSAYGQAVTPKAPYTIRSITDTGMTYNEYIKEFLT